MPYKINGTEITLQPTTGQWLAREEIARDGNGHPIYPAIREFEMTWQLISPTNVNQLQTFFDSVNPTGTVVAELPRYAFSSYTFYAYSGCAMTEPEYSTYFNQNYQDVSL